ncbi:hypothetical protein, partial [Escherichia coli]|uniref:hypothetical protein n=1 Tax=Escherichia coli TaxID=562 RepID=UPI001FCE6885
VSYDAKYPCDKFKEYFYHGSETIKYRCNDFTQKIIIEILYYCCTVRANGFLWFTPVGNHSWNNFFITVFARVMFFALWPLDVDSALK